jgi:hypothetical protein
MRHAVIIQLYRARTGVLLRPIRASDIPKRLLAIRRSAKQTHCKYQQKLFHKKTLESFLPYYSTAPAQTILLLSRGAIG